MQFQYEIQADHLIRALDAVGHALVTPAQLLASLGESLLRVNDERHSQGLAPDGTRWAPLKPSTLGSAIWKAQGKTFRKNGTMSLATARKVVAKKGNRILYDSGDLLRFQYQVDGASVVVGTNDWKAIFHHAGTGTYGPKGSTYTITPKTAKALAFNGLVRKRVTHPGIPARQLVGFPDSDRRLVGEVLDDHLTAVLQRANRK